MRGISKVEWINAIVNINDKNSTDRNFIINFYSHEFLLGELINNSSMN